MNNNNYTGKELSQKLHDAGCEFQADAWWQDAGTEFFLTHNDTWADYPAYDILNSLCVKYAVTLFDKDKVEEYTVSILKLLQNNEVSKAEQFIWEKTKYNKDAQ